LEELPIPPQRGEAVGVGRECEDRAVVPFGPVVLSKVIQVSGPLVTVQAVSLWMLSVNVAPASAMLSVGDPVTVSCLGTGAGAGAAQGARFISLAAQREPPIVVRQASATIQGVVLFIFVDILLCV